MRDAAGELADRLQLLRLPRAIAQLAALSDVEDQALAGDEPAVLREHARALLPDPALLAALGRHPVRQAERPPLGDGRLHRRPHHLAVVGVDQAPVAHRAALQEDLGRVAGDRLQALGHDLHGPVAVVAAPVDGAGQVLQEGREGAVALTPRVLRGAAARAVVQHADGHGRLARAGRRGGDVEPDDGAVLGAQRPLAAVAGSVRERRPRGAAEGLERLGALVEQRRRLPDHLVGRVPERLPQGGVGVADDAVVEVDDADGIGNRVEEGQVRPRQGFTAVSARGGLRHGSRDGGEGPRTPGRAREEFRDGRTRPPPAARTARPAANAERQAAGRRTRLRRPTSASNAESTPPTHSTAPVVSDRHPPAEEHRRHEQQEPQRLRVPLGAGRQLNGAPAVAVAAVDDEPDGHPDDQPQPGVERQAPHQVRAAQDAERRAAAATTACGRAAAAPAARGAAR